MTRRKQPQELLSLAGIARETGRTRQTLREQVGKLPPADYFYGAGARTTQLWKRSTLERAGVLDPKKTDPQRAEALGTSSSAESR